MPLSRYLKVYEDQQRPGYNLLYSTLRGSSVRIANKTLELARAGTLVGPEAEPLQRLGFLVPDLDREREQILGIIDQVDGLSRVFRGIVVLNLECNLDCGYCYEGGFRGGVQMSEATAVLLVEWLVREQISQGCDVSLSFYGGEPLLTPDLIRRISEPLLAAAREHQVRYNFNLVTNGTLLNRALAEELTPLGLNGAKFTLDGPPEVHNAQRPYASGAGSFETIVENLAAVCDLIPIQLGGNFTQENYREFPRLLDCLLEYGITGDRLMQVLFTPVTPQAGCSEYSAGCASSSASWLVDAQLFLREAILSRGFATSKPKVSACVVELKRNFVVNFDGSLYKCPTFMAYPDLSVGHLATGIADYRASHCIRNWQNERCLDCAYLPICFGGCRFLTLLQDQPLSEVECHFDFLEATLETFLLQNQSYPSPVPKGAPSASAAPPSQVPA
ncbi:radical SAM/SPASM domain-containing protein [Geomonas silvestris]|uniref:Radical SAM/SPASM domain-containing protein n=1 Tax=Geomonas silvestris TaxID=2740184 RepID=A0A6V8MN56_9BACT|nr:geopeptide radical SAM maturase [Geomonas silvestris]GFO61440.1 radical SAM/SPASM domain-containing protein [Geomonas silvestris]